MPLRGDATEAVAGLLKDGMTIAVGGFGLCGIPSDRIEAVRDSGVTGLTAIDRCSADRTSSCSPSCLMTSGDGGVGPDAEHPHQTATWLQSGAVRLQLLQH